MFYELFFIVCYPLVFAIVAPTLVFWFVGLFDGFPRLTLAQIGGIVAYAAWFSALLSLSPEERAMLVFVTVAFVSLVFAFCWKREFIRLMRMNHSDFNGTHDKLIWAIALTFLAPVGVWMFRSHQRSIKPKANLARETAGEWSEIDSAASEASEAIEGVPR